MSKPRIILENEDFPIKPADMNADEQMWGAFDNTESETSAKHILRLMQKKGDWSSFTFGELNKFYKSQFPDENPKEIRDFSFNHLVGPFIFNSIRGNRTERLDVIIREGSEDNSAYDIQDSDVFHITDEFVLRCYRSIGIRRMKAAATA